VRPDEFQDASSAGSLIQARRCWLDLLAVQTPPQPQRFAFGFDCPTEHMAVGLQQYLRYADPGSYVRMPARTMTIDRPAWRIVGTTNASIWSLPALEHLFMRLRSAARRYESTLEQVGLLSQEHVV